MKNPLFLVENYCLALLKKRYEHVSFRRVRKDEVDFLATNNVLDSKEYNYIEVKYRETISFKDLKFALKLSAKNGDTLIVVTKNDFAVHSDKILIPVWMLK